MKKQAMFPILIVLISLSAAVAQPNKKVGPALTSFLNTEFMLKYRDLRITAESAALSVQSNQSAGLAQSDVFRLRSAYDQTATRANQLLENIKQDFLMPKKLKTIAEFPEMYSDGLRYKLQELADYYSANFQQALADASVKVNGEEVDGSAVLLLVVELIGLTKGLASYFSAMKATCRNTWYNPTAGGIGTNWLAARRRMKNLIPTCKCRTTIHTLPIRSTSICKN